MTKRQCNLALSVDLFAPPFKGHLHPILAIALELQEMGCQVTVFSSAYAQAEIRIAGLNGIAIQGVDDEALFATVETSKAVGSSPFKLHRQFSEVLGFLGRVHHELDELYANRKPDLIISDFTLPVVGLVADKHGLPWWTSVPSPCVIECVDGTPAYLGGWTQGAEYLSKLRDYFGRKLVRTFKSLIFSLYRKPIGELGLSSLYRPDGAERIYSAERVLCLGEQALEFSRTWPTAVRFVGPMLYTPPSMAMSPKYSGAKRYVLMSMGTHLGWCKEGCFAALCDLAKQHPNWEFHFSDGNEQLLAEEHESPNCKRFGYIDYAANLVNYELVIHHGGAGIMYHCINLSLPSIVFPQDYDQHDHAARLVRLGLALRMDKLSELQELFAHLLTKQLEFKRRSGAFSELSGSAPLQYSLSSLIECFAAKAE